MMQSELRGKGIQAKPGDTSPAVTDKIALENLIAKLADRPRYADPARLIRYLQSKGFTYSDIKEVIKFREPETDEAP